MNRTHEVTEQTGPAGPGGPTAPTAPTAPDGPNGPGRWCQPAIEARGLGRRYRRGWALADCSFRLPAGRICGLVGPNGAGKSTLMSLVTGMARPTTGDLRVFGAAPQTPEGSLRTAFLSQDKPLFRRFTVAETLLLGARLNPSWDQRTAEDIVRSGNIPLTARTGTLSGGQRTRVAFALAFGKRPDLLVLDEPMSDLDPLVRQELTHLLAGEAAAHGTTVLISSHMLAELEYLCDFLLVMADGTIRLAGGAGELLAAHTLLTVGRDGLPPAVGNHLVVETRTDAGRTTALVRLDERGHERGRGHQPFTATGDQQAPGPRLEDLLLAYLRSPGAPPLICPSARAGDIHDTITGNPTRPACPTHPNTFSEDTVA